jgi:hypothetical protein
MLARQFRNLERNEEEKTLIPQKLRLFRGVQSGYCLVIIHTLNC